jgi:hypothetical protein
MSVKHRLYYNLLVCEFLNEVFKNVQEVLYPPGSSVSYLVGGVISSDH